MSNPHTPPPAQVHDTTPESTRYRFLLMVMRVFAIAGCILLCAIPAFNAFLAPRISFGYVALFATFALLSFMTLWPLFSRPRNMLAWGGILFNLALLALGAYGMIIASPSHPSALYVMLLYIVPSVLNILALAFVLVAHRVSRTHEL